MSNRASLSCSADRLGCSTHNAGFTQYPFPRELFEKFVRDNDGAPSERSRGLKSLTLPEGYFPVRLQALPEGTVVHANCPVYQARAGHSSEGSLSD